MRLAGRRTLPGVGDGLGRQAEAGGTDAGNAAGFCEPRATRLSNFLRRGIGGLGRDVGRGFDGSVGIGSGVVGGVALRVGTVFARLVFVAAQVADLFDGAVELAGELSVVAGEMAEGLGVLARRHAQEFGFAVRVGGQAVGLILFPGGMREMKI